MARRSIIFLIPFIFGRRLFILERRRPSCPQRAAEIPTSAERIATAAIEFHPRDEAIVRSWFRELHAVRKLIAFDDDTFDKLTQLGRGRMATLQELADEAFADLLKKHGIPIDLKDALRKSASASKKAATKDAKPRPPRKRSNDNRSRSV
jgi:hypothetical protein